MNESIVYYHEMIFDALPDAAMTQCFGQMTDRQVQNTLADKLVGCMHRQNSHDTRDCVRSQIVRVKLGELFVDLLDVAFGPVAENDCRVRLPPKSPNYYDQKGQRVHIQLGN